jgi:hypothetical protein
MFNISNNTLLDKYLLGDELVDLYKEAINKKNISIY